MVSEILDAGIALIQTLEGVRSPALNAFFLFITDFGSIVGYLILLPLIWWGFSWKLGVRLFIALVLSVYVNAVLKDFFALPRPFLYADVANLRTPDEYSFPSGHAQSAAVFWGLLALHFRKPWFTAVAAVMTFLIGFSRVYLGVHFPSDVLVGWTIGLLIVFAVTRWSRDLVEAVTKLSFGAQLGVALGVPVVLTLLHPTTGIAIAMGGLAGALGGLVVAYHKGLYPESRSRRAWTVVGLIGLPIIYFGFRLLSPGEGSTYYHLYQWSRFAAIGLWVSFLVPRIVAYFRRNSEASTA